MAATSRGIDVSSYQGTQDWAALARGGLTFAQVKASEGEHSRDEHYQMHMDGVLAVPSLLPMGYHYGWPNQDAHREADNYLGAVNDDADAHPAFSHALDLERAKGSKNYVGASDAEIRAYAEAWIDRVRAAHPRQRVGCYTSGDDIKRGHYPRNSDFLWYPAYPAGAMTYTQAEQRTRPVLGGIKALFWQFTSTPVDRSICYMTPAALRAWAGGTTEDTMALTDDDVRRIARQVVTGAAGMHAPGDPKTDWSLSAYVQAIYRQQAAQTAAITALAAQLGKGADAKTIVAAVEDAIARAVVRVEVVDGDPAPATTDVPAPVPAPAPAKS
ncbi:glycoside hydrolase family 25 protein [Streptomyces sp. NPDC020983]|uniref:glycoside hydrolase family 25 protein n=1 Tax=Streptomyces sp. NPDC020983 TaxID=3365106 RepID=UPI003796D9B1